MSETVRILWSGLKGEVVRKVKWPSIKHSSVIHISACEAGGGHTFGPRDRFIGDARISIHNIAPEDDNTVAFWISVDWGDPLDVFTDITILESPRSYWDASTQSWIFTDVTSVVANQALNQPQINSIGQINSTPPDILPTVETIVVR
jgi:hypothetical protein